MYAGLAVTVAHLQSDSVCAVLRLVARSAPAQLQQLLALPAQRARMRSGRGLQPPGSRVGLYTTHYYCVNNWSHYHCNACRL